MRKRARWWCVGCAAALALWASAGGTAGAEGFELSFGGAAMVGLPLGAFADQVGTPYGLGGHMAWGRPGRAFALRLEATGFIYGSETRRVPVGQPGLRQSLEVETTNGMATLGVGPQYVILHGPFRPYLTAFAGFSYFSTDSTVRADPRILPTAFSTNYDDTVFAYGGGIGILISLGHAKTGGLALDLGARFVGSGQVRYLAEGDLRDVPGGGVTFTPRQTEANRIEFHIGISGL